MKKQLVAFFLILLAVIELEAEIRSIWVLPWDMQSPKIIDEVIQNAIQNNQNELILEVRYRSDALYTPNRRSSKYSNPEPRSYILANNDFDPLEYAIEKAKPFNLRIQAWVVAFNATPIATQMIQENYIFRYHPEWITYDVDGKKMRLTDQYGYFIDPGIQAVQEYLTNVFCDIVDGYPDLDGLHLDYVRYPESWLGYHPESLKRFQEEGKDISWNQWRTKQVTDFVRNLNQRIKEINPEILLTAAVIADINSARESYAQDWYAWLEEGIIDLAYPMAYDLDFGIYRNQLINMKLYSLEDRVVLGLRAWDQSGKSLLPWENNSYNITDIYRRIELARKNDFRGIALFSYSGLKPGNALSHLALLAYPFIDELEVMPLLSNKFEDHAIRCCSQYVSKICDASTLIKDNHILEPEIEIKDTYYVIHFYLPREGRWHWRILNNNGYEIYDRKGYFLAGTAQEYWNGILNNGIQITAGNYILEYRLENQVYQTKIFIPGEID
nr:hypothetical protein [Candidatus Cloacimonadota bacterium]